MTLRKARRITQPKSLQKAFVPERTRFRSLSRMTHRGAGKQRRRTVDRWRHRARVRDPIFYPCSTA